MLKQEDILDEKNRSLHKISKEVIFPLSKEEKKKIKEMLVYLKKSQIEEIAERLNLRPGMGLAAIQVGIDKRFFVIVEEIDRDENDKQEFNNYVIVNPKLISHSEEMIYSELGEGCLSVNREVPGIVPRYARVTIEAYDENANKINIRAREELSIAFQHEIDHLNGILFTEKITEDEQIKNTMRAI